MALKQNKSGLNVLKETLTALDDAKIPLERRLKWQKDIQIMIALMSKNRVQDGKFLFFKHLFLKHRVHTA